MASRCGGIQRGTHDHGGCGTSAVQTDAARQCAKIVHGSSAGPATVGSAVSLTVPAIEEV